MSLPTAVEHITDHILRHLGSAKKPLFVALQGPQGSGKSYLTGLVQSVLSSPPHLLSVALVSIDDLYLPHKGLQDLAENNLNNPLWRGRGQPGTHDIALGLDVLQRLKDGVSDVEIPRFEKSLFNGEGDRLPFDRTGVIVKPPVDVVIMEGWCTGFYPISQTELDKRWNGVWSHEKDTLQLSDTIVGTKESVEDINKTLSLYVDLWSYFDVFIQLKPLKTLPSPYSVIYKWRLQQEHNMKAKNGGIGMTDEAVKYFIDRYIPGYVFFGDGVTQGYIGEDQVLKSKWSPRWLGKGLRVLLDDNRIVNSIERF